MAVIGAASEGFVRERYSPYRAEHGKRLHFETADFRALLSPFDRSHIATVGYMDASQAMENLETLHRTFRERRQPRTHERIEIMKRTAALLAARQESFADLIAWEGGKPLKDARIEVVRAVNSLEYAAEEAGRLQGREVPMRATAAASGRIAFTYPEPIGVVLAISAFNHPLNLIVHQVAPAIAVGCPVLVKPASDTPLSCLHFLELLYEAGLAPEMCLPLLSGGDVAELVARSPKVGFVTFIGSAKVGWHLKSVLAPGTRFSLEHGGSAPVIVEESADLEKALPILVRGAFYHSGQVCVSTQRILVHEAILTEFESRFLEAVKALKCGNPRFEQTDCGPIIRKSDLQRIDAMVKEAQVGGAKLLLGGEALGETIYAPTVLRGAAKEARVLREEVFGPVAHIEAFREWETAIERANDTEWSFQAGVFCRDLDRSLEIASRLDASAVMINDGTSFRVDWMPFRGDGPSGFGTGGIPFTMHDMIREKMVVIKSPAFEL
jgi:acyl-CoA reductase-like NAD-dependent aldehyde dehydrogenase